MQHKQLEEEELSLLEKKKQREVARKEFTDDLKFKTTFGQCVWREYMHVATQNGVSSSRHFHKERQTVVLEA